MGIFEQRPEKVKYVQRQLVTATLALGPVRNFKCLALPLTPNMKYNLSRLVTEI